MGELSNFYKDKTILVTGGVGSIGSEIVREVLKFDPKVVRILDNNETGLFNLEHELKLKRIRLFIGDVRDKERLIKATEGVDIIFHAAALKHVPLCEYNPYDAVKTNVIGTQNLIDAALSNGVKKVIFVSTDKAVNPRNVMGATKLLAERLTILSNFYLGLKKFSLSCVRFGNVMDSSGSVIPLFKDQITNGGPVTVTDKEMTRFIMSIPNAVELILKAGKMANGGEIFILKMPAIKIGDLAEVMIEELSPKLGHDPNNIEMKIIGRRASEKLYEELMTEDEAENAYENDEMFVMLPQLYDILGDVSFDLPAGFIKTQSRTYSSNEVKLLAKEEIKTLLNDLDLKRH